MRRKPKRRTQRSKLRESADLRGRVRDSHDAGAGFPTPHAMQLRGFGLGLRPTHYEAVLNEPHAIDWLEIITENYLVPGRQTPGLSGADSRAFSLAMHGVSLSIGSTDPLDREYLAARARLSRRIEPALDFRSSVLDGSRGPESSRSFAAALYRRGARRGRRPRR